MFVKFALMDSVFHLQHPSLFERRLSQNLFLHHESCQRAHSQLSHSNKSLSGHREQKLGSVGSSFLNNYH